MLHKRAHVVAGQFGLQALKTPKQRRLLLMHFFVRFPAVGLVAPVSSILSGPKMEVSRSQDPAQLMPLENTQFHCRPLDWTKTGRASTRVSAVLLVDAYCFQLILLGLFYFCIQKNVSGRRLGFSFFLCDWHGFKSFDSELSTVIGFSKEACLQANWLFRLLKRSRSQAFSSSWKDLAVATLKLWINQLKFGLDAQCLLDFVSYVETWWLRPVILSAWTDEAALTQEGYETTNNSVEGMWKHLDSHVFLGYHNTNVSSAIEKIMGIGTNGKPTSNLGLFERASVQLRDAAGGSAELDPSDKRRQMRGLLQFIIHCDSQADAPQSDDRGTAVLRKFDDFGFFGSEICPVESFDASLYPVVQQLCQSVLGSHHSYPVPGGSTLTNQPMNFCSCKSYLWRGPFTKTRCKHLDFLGHVEQLRDCVSAEAKLSYILNQTHVLAKYLKHLHGSKKSIDSSRIKEFASIEVPEMTATSFMQLCRQCRQSACPSHDESGEVAGLALSPPSPSLYRAVFSAETIRIGANVDICDGFITIHSFKSNPDGTSALAAHDIQYERASWLYPEHPQLRALDKIVSVNGKNLSGFSSMEVHAILTGAIERKEPTVLALQPAQGAYEDTPRAQSHRKRKPKHSSSALRKKGRKTSNTAQSSQVI